MSTQFSAVNCRYGSPMGRREYRSLNPVFRSVRCFRVNLDSGGYDDGGAYWGTSRPLYCLQQDGSDFRVFIRADTRFCAILKSRLALDMFKQLRPDGRWTITREWVGDVSRHYVIRFCGEFVGSERDENRALDILRRHAFEHYSKLGRI